MTADTADLRERPKMLGFMAALSDLVGEQRAAEGYLLELLAFCAFAGNNPDDD